HPRRRCDPVQSASQQVGQYGQQPSGGAYADYLLRRHANLPANQRQSLAEQYAGFQYQQQDTRQLQLHVRSSAGCGTLRSGGRLLRQCAGPAHSADAADQYRSVRYALSAAIYYRYDGQFLPPFPGYNNVAWTDNAYNSNYHALLLAINRRFASGLQFGFSY